MPSFVALSLLTGGCFSDPGDSMRDTDESSSEDVSSSGSENACEGVIDVCGVCDGSGAPCLGCTVPEASNYDELADTYDGTCMCTAQGTPVRAAAQLDAPASAGGLSQWQSFTAEAGGGLSSISIELSSPLGVRPGSGTLEVFEGEGPEGNRIVSTEVEIEAVALAEVQEFVFDELVPITAGGVYSWQLSIDEQNIGFLSINTSNPYDGGRFSQDEDTDAVFRVDVVACTPDPE